MASKTAAIAGGEWHPPGSSRSVEARLVERGGEIAAVPAGGDKPLAGAGLSWVEVSGRVGSIPRRVTFPDGSIFETWDNDGIDRYLAARGRGGAGFVHWLEQFRLRLVVIVLIAFALGGAVYRWGVPALVEVAVWTTPPIVPELMGEGTLQALDKTAFSPSKLPETRRKEIADGFARIAALSPRGAGAYALNFRDGGIIGPNAFALPDGSLVVTDQLVEMADGDTEMIVGVLAHEIGHVELDHSLRQFYRAAGMTGLIMLIAGDVGSAVEDVLVQGGGLLALSYSREAEAEADRRSVELMAKAGYDPAAIARFFALIEEKLGDTSDTDILSTHPGTPQRKKDILDYARIVSGQSDPDLQ
ncbi:M48 family metallopeptidase [Shinella zoogloeoides]|uniref:M48 family metalloprotease n=1 Tax=Shinella zoogloeoides TaxID=352475 RepID=A0A6N8TEJ5_SHIZO|nr:M48 family metallopeptidase [Shinella zoogloeoides]MXO01697.1 M48 family metalloprotease [Shinella zoogloeoides]UEX82142.1 M48 family metallopeptidase [Shinella zoogloeoides]